MDQASKPVNGKCVFDGLSVTLPQGFNGGDFHIQFIAFANYMSTNQIVVGTSRFVSIRVLPPVGQMDAQVSQLIWQSTGACDTALPVPWPSLGHALQNYFSECIPVERKLSREDLLYLQKRVDPHSRGSVDYKSFREMMATFLYPIFEWLCQDVILREMWNRFMILGFTTRDGFALNDVVAIRFSTRTKKHLSVGNVNGWRDTSYTTIARKYAEDTKQPLKLATGLDAFPISDVCAGINFPVLPANVLKSSASSAFYKN
jgi:hypothetical protein